MKKIIMFVLLLTIVSCDYSYLYFPFGEYEYDETHESIEDVFDWIINNIQGADFSGVDLNAVYTTKKGDCTQQCWLMIDKIYSNFGIKASYISYFEMPRDKAKHAVVLINNTVYDPAYHKKSFHFDQWYALNFQREIIIYDFWYLQQYWFEFK